MEWRYSSTIFDLGTRWNSGQLHAPEALLPVPIRQAAGWVPEQISTLCKREKSLTHAGNRNSVVQPVIRRNTD
jgi:hypothetical protein